MADRKCSLYKYPRWQLNILFTEHEQLIDRLMMQVMADHINKKEILQ